MKFGIKVEPGRLDEPSWVEMYGPLERFFVRLRRFGLDFVELAWGPEQPLDRLVAAGRKAVEAGLFCSVHPYLRGELGPEAFGASPPPGLAALLEAAAELAGLSGVDATMVFHGGLSGYEPYFATPADAVAAAQRFFAYLDSATAERFRRVQVVCETQMPRFPGEGDWERVGDTWESCLELVAGTGLGVCWDFGHTFGSARIGKHAPVPPEEFVRRVRHVHAHDTFPVGERILDHRPLGDGLCPWREYLRLLAAGGYDGNVLFEFQASFLGDYDAVARVLKDNVGKVSAIMG